MTFKNDESATINPYSLELQPIKIVILVVNLCGY